jgi:FkbM family methyltransferase
MPRAFPSKAVLFSLSLFAVLLIASSAAADADVDTEKKWNWVLASLKEGQFEPSQVQRRLIRHFFRERRDGVFVDIGSAHYEDGSMTFFLEESFGWSGLAVDALESWAEGYEQHRPRTRFFSYIVTDHSGAKEPFYLVRNEIGSTAEKEWADEIQERFEDLPITEIRVPTTTMDTLLDREGVTKFDFLSMDIEGSELKALAGFDIERFRPELVCVEVFPKNRERIHAYFEEHGYRRIETYVGYDPRNWYYTCNKWQDCADERRPSFAIE